MKSLLIHNSGSGKSEAIAEVRNHLDRHCEFTNCKLDRDTNLIEEIASAIARGVETVIAAGGDGTVNAVVNALMQQDVATRPKLLIVPLGTANDFAGTMQIQDNWEQTIGLLANGTVAGMDVVRISADRFERYYANVAAGGNSVRVSENLTDQMKESWGAFCYIRGALDVLADMQTYDVTLRCDNETFRHESWGVIIANGRTNAGGIPVAPQASPCDGKMDVILIRDGTMIDMAEIVSKTLLASFLDCEQVIFRQATQVRLDSNPAMRFTLDGEVIDETPVQFDVVPAAINVYVGESFGCSSETVLKTSV